MEQDDYQGQQGNNQQAYRQPPMPPQPTGNSGLAVGALVCGLLGLVTCVTAIPAIIMGHLALNKIKGNPRLGGRGMAVAGLVLGYVCLALGLVVPGLLLPAISSVRNRARQIWCTNNTRMIGLGMALYADEESGYFPVSRADVRRHDPLSDLGLWVRSGLCEDTERLICPADEQASDPVGDAAAVIGRLERRQCSYSLNALERRMQAMLPGVAMISDEPRVDGQNSANHGTSARWAGQTVVFSDFHVEWLKTPQNDPDPNIFLENPGVPNDAYIPDTGP